MALYIVMACLKEAVLASLGKPVFWIWELFIRIATFGVLLSATTAKKNGLNIKLEIII